MTSPTQTANQALNCWVRIQPHEQDKLKQVQQSTGVDVLKLLDNNLTQEGDFTCFPITFLSIENGKRKTSRAVFILGPELLVSVEPDPSPASMNIAFKSLSASSAKIDSFLAFATILQTINDETDKLLDSLNDDLGKVLVQTNSVLNSLEAKDRDFGISDVVSAQLELGEVEELLSDCIESQLQLALAARHAVTLLPASHTEQFLQLNTLIEDIEAVEEHVSFVHNRVRLLQATNNMALNVKQNQIVKVFSVITAVFLPAMLISTYYSMNIANMPILEWQYGEPVVILLTAALALLPLMYVKRRGWLR